MCASLWTLPRLPVAAWLLLICAYTSSYLSLVERVTSTNSQQENYDANYRVGGELASNAFEPIHRFDLVTRTDYWRDPMPPLKRELLLYKAQLVRHQSSRMQNAGRGLTNRVIDSERAEREHASQ